MSGTLSKSTASIQGNSTGKTLSKYYCIYWRILLRRNSILFYKMPPNLIHVSDTLSKEYCIHSRTFFETKTFPEYYCIYWSILLQSNITFSKKYPPFPKSVSFSVYQFLVYRERFVAKAKISKGCLTEWVHKGSERNSSIQPLWISDSRFKIQNKLLESKKAGFNIQAAEKMSTTCYGHNTVAKYMCIHMYIYMYIYVCVCVCVCVRIFVNAIPIWKGAFLL